MGQLFLGDFETGDASQFTSATGSVIGTPVLSGVYSGRNGDNNNFRKVLSTEYPTIYIHGWFRWSVDPSTASNWFVVVTDGVASSQFALYINAGKLRMYINATGTYYNGVHPLVADTWYEIEVKYITHDTNGEFTVEINGSLDITASSIDTKNGTDTGIKTVKWQGINTTGYCYVDNLSLNDTVSERNNYVVRVSLPGYNALTDTNPDHYSLYTDEDLVLIKELARGTSNVAYGGTTTLTHGLGYIPFVSVWYKDEIDSNQWNLISGIGKNNVTIQVTSTELKLINNSVWSVAIDFRYYVFYDNFS